MARKTSKPIEAEGDRLKLIEALKFAAIAIDNQDDKTFVAIRDNWLTAENETFGIGCPVPVALDLCPQADLFSAALRQCGQLFQLTQVSLNGVSIKSGNFRALVPAIERELLSSCVPDAPCAVIDDKLKDAFAATVKVTGKGERLINKCVLMRAGSMVGTNGGIALEYWHGIDLPKLCIPKKTAETLAKITKPFAAFGLSDRSATFYFADSSFLKTRLIAGDYPDVDRLFNAPVASHLPLWVDFYVALAAVNGFVQDDTVFFHGGCLGSHREIELGASYQVAGLPGGLGYSPTYWRIIEPYITHVQAQIRQGEPLSFYGPHVRGLIMGKNV